MDVPHEKRSNSQEDHADRDNLIDVDFLDQEEALYSEVEKRKFLFKRLLEKRQHYSDDESDTIE